ncbi:transposase domain-containing protein [Streptomyces sp. UG1]|uniref:transposase domain-containing protein n=1 Tax=Streptomyces sp. UG1 TaxID=3417652 RepID=UPI003CF5FDEB
MYARGLLGELPRAVDFAPVDAVLEETGARERRLRLLPSRVVVYFVLAPTLRVPARVRERGAQFLMRSSARRVPTCTGHLAGGSYLPRLGYRVLSVLLPLRIPQIACPTRARTLRCSGVMLPSPCPSGRPGVRATRSPTLPSRVE